MPISPLLMMRQLIVQILILSGLFPTSPGMAQKSSTSPPGYSVVFSDDFRNLDLSPDGGGAHRWYEGVWFSHHRAPISNIQSSEDGLKLIWRRGQEQADTSISTFSRNAQEVHKWRHGYFEIRMRWTPTRGAWPAVWLIPASAETLKESGEMDIFEGNGEHPLDFYGTVHHWVLGGSGKMEDRENNGSSNRFIMPRDFDFTKFHTYGMLWTSDRITWYMDGKELHEERSYGIFSQQEYSLVIGMQEGVGWKAGNLQGVSADRMDLDVDWIKVWQKQ